MKNNLSMDRIQSTKRKAPPRQVLVLVGVTAALLIMGSIINPKFLVPMNIANILTISALLGLVSIGQTLVVLSGDNGLDLSVGAVMSLGAVFAAWFMGESSGGVWVALAIVLGAGALIGFLNSIGIVFAKIPALVMTLAMASVISCVELIFTNGQPKGTPDKITSYIATNHFLPFLTWLVVLWVGIIILVHLLLTRTSYGIQLYATGANRNAAFLAGIRVNKIRVITYTLCGMLSAFAGFWLCAYNGVIYVDAGASYVMPSVAAVVIGGTSLAGGKGTYTGTVIGAIILTIINSLLIMLNTDDAGRNIINGVLLVVLLAVYTRQPSLRQ